VRLTRAICVPAGFAGRALCVPSGFARRLSLLFMLAVLAAPALRAEYVVLRSGQRIKVTGYQLQGDKYHLQLGGGFVDVPAADVVAIEPEDTFAPLPAAPPPAAGPQPFYRDLVEAAAKRYNMDADLITSVIAVESNFDPKAVSRKNARGLMQLLPETAAQLGVKNIDDPAENIDAGTRYLRDLLQKYNNDLALALAAYNAGPDKVQLYGRVPPYAETISYVRRVKRGYEKSKSAPAAKAPASPAPSASPVTIVPPAPVAASSPPRTDQPQSQPQ
jgi:soluble lytic murein transglycosylase-like protein